MPLTGEKKNKYMRQYYIKNKDRIKVVNWKRYGVITNDWDELLQRFKQQTNCDICGVHRDDITNNLHIDHDHSTGIVRGFLCSSCNTGIGLLKTITNLARAINYLKENKNGNAKS